MRFDHDAQALFCERPPPLSLRTAPFRHCELHPTVIASVFPCHCERSAAISPTATGGRWRPTPAAVRPGNGIAASLSLLAMTVREARRQRLSLSLRAQRGNPVDRNGRPFAPHPSGRSPRQRDCRVAIAPRNDSWGGASPASFPVIASLLLLPLRAQHGNPDDCNGRPFAHATGLPRRYRSSQ